MVEVLKTLTSIITSNMFGNQMKMLNLNPHCHETFPSSLFGYGNRKHLFLQLHLNPLRGRECINLYDLPFSFRCEHDLIFTYVYGHFV